MSNNFLTIDMITREAVELWFNSNAFIQNIDTQYDNQFAREGAKIGTTLRIRLPNDYTVNDGPTISIQDTAEQQTTLTVATQKNVAISANTLDRTLKMDDFNERYLAPMINNLTGKVASTIMGGSEGGVCNLIYNGSTGENSGTIQSPVAQTFLDAGAILDNNSTPQGNVRKLVNSPTTDARAVGTLTGLFNPATAISKQYETGQMYNALGWAWMKDQTVINHTSGSFSAGTVNGANQTGTTITTNAITGTLKKGDIITFASVNAVNRITKVTTGQARQFVVLADVASTSTSISIYPALIPASGTSDVQYQTVDISPADTAAITLVTPASTTYRKNIGFARDAITMVSADLYMPTTGVVEAARHAMDSISLRMITAYQIGTDQAITRLDVLFGYLYVRPEWAVVICDQTP